MLPFPSHQSPQTHHDKNIYISKEDSQCRALQPTERLQNRVTVKRSLSRGDNQTYVGPGWGSGTKTRTGGKNEDNLSSKGLHQ